MNEFAVPAEYDRSNCKFNSRDSEKEKHPLHVPIHVAIPEQLSKPCVENMRLQYLRLFDSNDDNDDDHGHPTAFETISLSPSSPSYITLRIIYRSFSIQLSNIHILLSSGFDRHQRCDRMFAAALCKTNRAMSQR